MHWSFNSNEPGLDCAVHKVFPWPWLQRDCNHRRWLRSRSHVRRWDRYLKRNICLMEVVSFCHTCLPHAGSESNPLNKGARAQASAGTCKENTTQSRAARNTGNVQKVCCDSIRLKNSLRRWAESVFPLRLFLRHEWSKERSGLFSPLQLLWRKNVFWRIKPDVSTRVPILKMQSNPWQTGRSAGRLLGMKCCDMQLKLLGSCRGPGLFTVCQTDEPERPAFYWPRPH